ncbi:MAG: UDP binding domain-containing protein, partial [Methylococcales bacterium]
GLTFKENCPDIRNTRVVDMIEELKGYHTVVEVFDPWVDSADVQAEIDVKLIDKLNDARYDAIILAVAHRQFREMGATQIRALGKPECVLFDVKDILPRDQVDGAL